MKQYGIVTDVSGFMIQANCENFDELNESRMRALIDFSDEDIYECDVYLKKVHYARNAVYNHVHHWVGRKFPFGKIVSVYVDYNDNSKVINLIIKYKVKKVKEPVTPPVVGVAVTDDIRVKCLIDMIGEYNDKRLSVADPYERSVFGTKFQDIVNIFIDSVLPVPKELNNVIKWSMPKVNSDGTLFIVGYRKNSPSIAIHYQYVASKEEYVTTLVQHRKK